MGGITSWVLVRITVPAALAGWTIGPAVARGVTGGQHDPSRIVARRSVLRRVLASPGSSLLAVTSLIYLNQVLFTVYVITLPL